MLKYILLFIFAIFPANANPVSHEAVYRVGLDSTQGGASSVVAANGIMRYRVQKVCNVWHTETIFSLDVSYELSGIDTTNWKQTTIESLDGCLFDFDVFIRDKGADKQDLVGNARCENGKKVLHISYPTSLTADFPTTVKFPLEQTVSWIDAARAGKKSFSSFVFDGTRADALMAMNAVVADSEIPKKPAADWLKGLKAYQFDFAFYPTVKNQETDGLPLYESSALYYENGVADHIRQNFNTHVLRSDLTSLKRLNDIGCEK